MLKAVASSLMDDSVSMENDEMRLRPAMVWTASSKPDVETFPQTSFNFIILKDFGKKSEEQSVTDL